MATNTAGSRRLSPSSEYEQTFQTRHRPPGRPSRDDGEPLFPRVGVPPVIGRAAERRAYALVHEKYRHELAAIYRAELAILLKRGEEVVAADLGIKLEEKG